MRALIYREFGSAEVLEWADGQPTPVPGPDQVLVKVAAGSINPKDVLLRKGIFPRMLDREKLPRGSGLDLAGTVVARGHRVTDLKVGDQVFGMTNRFAGGVHRELVAIDATQVALAPKTLTPVEAAAVPLAALTALQALRDCAGLKPGQSVLINGASGGVGHFAVQVARCLGAEVTAVCGARNLEFVQQLGAQRAVDYGETPAWELPETFDVVFDVFGAGRCGDYRRQLGRKGIYVNTIPKPVTLWAEGRARLGLGRRNRLVIVNSNRRDLNLLRLYIDAGRLKPVVDGQYLFSDAAQGHRHVESRHTRGKVVLMAPGQGSATS
ncbi:MAG: NAD(P)-dependent alcohol dehydrogenase [Halomonadaceae bacterium]|nr:MAG: NAD(P)-dependent alcohol dehydrogenase [Halomonadaceae bacterium]